MTLRRILGAGTPRKLRDRATKPLLGVSRRFSCRNRPDSVIESQNAPGLAFVNLL